MQQRLFETQVVDKKKQKIQCGHKTGCEGCPLNKGSKRKVINISKLAGRPIALWAEAPGEAENREGLELVGKAGRKFWKDAKKAGFSREDCDIQNVVRCRPTRSVSGMILNRAPNKEELYHCSKFTDKALTKMNAKVFLILGVTAAQQLLGKDYKKSTKSFWSDKLNAHVICTTHPSYFLRTSETPDKVKKREYMAALRLAAQLIGYVEKGKLAFLKQQDYKGIATVDTVREEMERIKKECKGTGERLSVDIENGVVDNKPVMLCIGYNFKQGRSRTVFIDHPGTGLTKSDRAEIIRLQKEVLEDPKIQKTLHFGTSDARTLKKLLRIKLRGFEYDTNYAEYHKFSGKGAYGLGAIAESRFLPFAGYKGLVAQYSGNYADIPYDLMVLYNGADADLGKRIEVTTRDFVNLALIKAYTYASYTVSAMQSHGPVFDYEHHKIVEKIIPVQLAALTEKLKSMARDPDFNPGSPKQVAHTMYVKLGIRKIIDRRTHEEDEGTGDAILAILSSLHEFPRLMRVYRGLSKMNSTYLKAFKLSADLHAGLLATIWWLCMPASELVMTSRGYVAVNKVRVGDLVITHLGRPKPVGCVVKNGVKPIVRVELSNGMVLKTTPNHQYFCNGEWVRADKLKIDSEITTYGKAEVWKRLVRYPFFSVSSWGRVRNDKTQKILKQKRMPEYGHLVVRITANEPPVYPVLLVRDSKGRISGTIASKTVVTWEVKKVSALVAMAFLPVSNNPEVRHLNGHCWDNTVWNLKTGTRRQNVEDAMRHGSTIKEKKITQETVDYIRSFKPHQRSDDSELSKRLGVSRRTVSDIRLNKFHTIRHIGKVINFGTSKVVKITTEKDQMTYGIMVADDHSHVTGGMVTHNTGTITGRMSSGGGSTKKKDDGIVNLQNIHGDPIIENMIVSDPQWRMLTDTVDTSSKRQINQLWTKSEKITDNEEAQKNIEQQIIDIFRRCVKKALSNSTFKRLVKKLKVLFGVDWSQLEIRMLAHMANDPVYLAVFSDPKNDPHSVVGADLTGLPVAKIKKDRVVRTFVKALHFAMVYGKKPQGIKSQMEAEGMKNVKLKDVERFYNAYFEKYKGVRNLLDNLVKQAEETGFTETIFGFKREVGNQMGRASFWGNQAVNGPVQGGAHQLMVIVLAILHLKPKKYNLLEDLRMEVHDSLYAHVELKDLPEVFEQSKYLMEHEILDYVEKWFGFKMRVPLIAEAKAGFRLGTIVEYKGETMTEFLVKWLYNNEKVNRSIDASVSKLNYA